MLETNERKIKIIGTANIPTDLKLDKIYDLTVGSVECKSGNAVSNNDGTKDIVYKLYIDEKSEINIISEKEIVRAIKKGSQSKLMRHLIMQLADKYDEEQEHYYQQRMSELIDILRLELDS